jgi:hypothetical protein
MQKNLYTLLAICCLAVVISACRETTPDADARLFPIKENSRWGYMDASGKVVVAPAFDYAWDFAEGRGRIKDKGRYGFVTIEGDVIIKPSFSYADDFQGGYARVNITDTTVADVTFDGYSLHRGWTFVDPAGVVFDQTFASVERFNEGISIVKDEPGYDAEPRYVMSYVDKLVMQDRAAVAIFDYNHGPLAPASDPETGKLGAIDRTEEWVIQPAFDELTPFSEEIASARKSNQYGYINEQGGWIYSQVIPVDQNFYPDRRPFSNGLAAVQVVPNEYQYIDKTGKPAFKGRFKTVSNFTEEGYAIVSTSAGTGVIDKTGNWAVKPNLDVISVNKGVVIYRTNKGMGARDLATQKDIVPAEYTNIDFLGTLLRLRNTGATAGYIDTRGEFVVKPQFDNAWAFAKDKAVVSVKDEMIYVDKTGRKLGAVPEKESPYYYPMQDVYVSMEDGKYGYQKDDQWVIPAEYDLVTEMEGNVGRINLGAMSDESELQSKGGKWGLVDIKGKELVPPTYELIMPYRNGTALVNVGGDATYSFCEGDCEEGIYFSCLGGKWGLIDQRGKVVLEPAYDRLIPFGNNFLAGNGEEFSLVDATGKALSEGSFVINVDELFELESDFVPAWYTVKFTTARQDGKMGVLTPEGKWLVKPEYNSVVYANQEAETPFTEGLVVVQIGEKWGAVNEAGTLVIPAAYDAMRNFAGGLAAVMSNGRWGFIDKTNNKVVEPVYISVRDFQGDVAIVQREEKAPELVIDRKGTVTIDADPTITYGYEGFTDGVCILTNGDAGYSVINSNGKILFAKGSLSEVKVQKGGLFYAIKDNKWAMVNRDGVMLTGFDYSWIETYTGQEFIRCNKGGEQTYDEMTGEQLAYGGLWGMVDKNGAVRIPLKFADLEPFSEGLAMARASENLDEVGYVDLSGKVVSPLKK